jgi:hypothetical protein
MDDQTIITIAKVLMLIAVTAPFVAYFGFLLGLWGPSR